MASFVPQTVLPDFFVHHRDRSRLSQHALPSITTFPSSTDSSCSSRRSLQCAAITGGSKRDVEKLVARTQHRRPRHRKGMAPSNNDLLEELEMEEKDEEVVENEVTGLVSEDIPSNDSSEPSPAKDATSGPMDLRAKKAANDAAEGAQSILEKTEDTATSVVDTAADTQKQLVSDAAEGGESLVGGANDAFNRQLIGTSSGPEARTDEVRGSTNAANDAAEGAASILETTEDTLTSVVDTAADTQKQVVSDAAKGAESLVGGISETANRQPVGSSSKSETRTDEVRDSEESITDTTMDTASYVGDKMNETGQQVQQDMAESASSIGEVFDSQANSAMNEFREQANKAEASGKAVADAARDTTEFVSEKINETGKQLGQDFTEVAQTGQSLFQDGSETMSQQAKDFSSQAERVLKEEGNILEQSAARIQNEASKSLDRVQDSVQRAVQESARAARSIGREALGMGELIVDTAKEAIQGTPGFAENKQSKSGVLDKGREDGSQLRSSQLASSITDDRPSKRGVTAKGGNGSQPQSSQQEDKGRFADFNVLVAGASGQTGRLVVENLVSNGASVRALVRNAYKARSIQQLRDCECIEADLYKYETVKKAIGDSNVIVCAIGARAFPLDPFSTYQVEYEGVLNLISAAKNQGNVKKFILISTIGVTYLQLVPLLFWKKQAELYLQRSGLDYTIVRPGGLRNTREPEDVVMQGADSQFFGGISRKKVAEVCVTAITASDASDKIVEVVSVPGSQKRSIEDLFKLV